MSKTLGNMPAFKRRKFKRGICQKGCLKMIINNRNNRTSSLRRKEGDLLVDKVPRKIHLKLPCIEAGVVVAVETPIIQDQVR
jgi:hypothetical protein